MYRWGRDDDEDAAVAASQPSYADTIHVMIPTPMTQGRWSRHDTECTTVVVYGWSSDHGVNDETMRYAPHLPGRDDDAPNSRRVNEARIPTMTPLSRRRESPYAD